MPRRVSLFRRYAPYRLPRRFWIALTVPALLVLLGSAGYRLIEGDTWTWPDALYMTVITLTTVGFREVHPLSPPGQAFTAVLCLGGIFTLFYVAGATLRAIVSGEVRDILGNRRMAEELALIRDHHIVCGFGRTGHMVCAEFERQRLPYVIIDRDEPRLAGFDEEYGLPLVGDAGSDEVLRQAGVERARSLITVLSNDADNLFIVLSAKLLNDKLHVVSRASDEAAEQKLRRAGADEVVLPHVIGGHRMAQAVLRPTVVRFLDLATHSPLYDYQIEEFRIAPGSPFAGKTLAEAKIHHEFGTVVVALHRPDGVMLTNPHGDTALEPGSVIVALGKQESLDQLSRRIART